MHEVFIFAVGWMAGVGSVALGLVVGDVLRERRLDQESAAGGSDGKPLAFRIRTPVEVAQRDSARADYCDEDSCA